MLEPKFVPYITKKRIKTKHGYLYSALSDSAPEKLKKEYMRLVMKQDELAAKGEPVFKF